MNQACLVGRLTNDPEIRYTQGENRKRKKQRDPTADFIRCVAFGRNAEFAEKYMFKGLRFGITGSIQTGSYKNKDGQTVYTTDIIVNSQDFCDSKQEGSGFTGGASSDSDGFMNIPDGVEDEGLPFV